ncbi:hypothetical protein ACIGXM_37065 [Kitasatospora sp. NPDC052896]|uniref:hypothetical protein n=1 Tax=Kitasatospora sp. NPDC052896 TaxID=3364061 RepID=UPI0037C96089
MTKRLTKRLAAVGVSTGAAVAMLFANSLPAAAASQTMALNDAAYGCGWASTSSSVHLVFQCDGNLVLYRNSDGHAMWASGSYSSGGSQPNTIRFQNRGFVELTMGLANVCGFGDNSIGHDATGGYAVVQDDGNFVVYTSGGSAVWQSGTYGNQQGSTNACNF